MWEPYIFWGIAILSLAFFFLYDSTAHGLLIVLTLWGIMIFVYAQATIREEKQKEDTGTLRILKGIQMAQQAQPSNLFFVHKFPSKGMKYLLHSPELLNIVKDIMFVRTFELARYHQLCLIFDRLQKAYEYILGERFYFRTAFPLFVDLCDNARHTLASFLLVIPKTLKHSYGFQPHEVLNKNIGMLDELLNRKLRTLENFARHHLKEPYIPSYTVRPYEQKNIEIV